MSAPGVPGPRTLGRKNLRSKLKETQRGHPGKRGPTGPVAGRVEHGVLRGSRREYSQGSNQKDKNTPECFWQRPIGGQPIGRERLSADPRLGEKRDSTARPQLNYRQFRRTIRPMNSLSIGKGRMVCSPDEPAISRRSRGGMSLAQCESAPPWRWQCDSLGAGQATSRQTRSRGRTPLQKINPSRIIRWWSKRLPPPTRDTPPGPGRSLQGKGPSREPPGFAEGRRR